MNTEAFALSGFLSFLSNQAIRRERPYVRACRELPSPEYPPCIPDGQNEGFFSGHTTIAFTGAMLTCWHAARLPLYGTSRIGSAASCIAGVTSATIGGIARLVTDKHYISDVIVGAAVGIAAGFLVPLFHYGRAGNGSSAAAVSTGPPAAVATFASAF